MQTFINLLTRIKGLEKHYIKIIQFGTFDTGTMTFEATESFFGKMMC